MIVMKIDVEKIVVVKNQVIFNGMLIDLGGMLSYLNIKQTLKHT
jgi:hypothetical protein